jgi:hypothetical protein
MRQGLSQQFGIAKPITRDVGEGVFNHILQSDPLPPTYCPAVPEVGLKSISRV